MTASKPAENLADALRAFNPAKPLDGESDPYFALRPEETDKLLLDLQADNNPRSKLLFTGHRGSGKSTETMPDDQAANYFAVYYTVEDVLDMAFRFDVCGNTRDDCVVSLY